MICEGGGKRKFDTFDDHHNSDNENEDPNKELIKGHSGCGNRQPVFRKEGLRLAAVTKPTASEVHTSLYSRAIIRCAHTCQSVASKIGRRTDKRSVDR